MTETPPPTAPAAAPPQAWLAPAALVLALLAVAGVAWLGLQGYTRTQSLETQLARRIGESDAASREARAAAKAANEALADLQNRLVALETRAQEAQNQQLALTAMYEALADSADERVVADIEQTLLLAQQQLQLAGNVKAALIGLEAADTRLAQLGKPQFAALRTAIVQDTARLKLMPAADIDGMNARIETLVHAVDSLKPESDSEPAPPPAPAARGVSLDTLGAFGREAWNEIKGLLRIRRLDHPELPLLTPSQHYFLQQNLKLRLLAARLDVLQRDEAAFRADLAAARDWVARYFNPRDPATQAFQASLGELLKAPLALRDAQIQASLKAVRAARGNKE
ncbi:MAG: uroporphyrinogen-III C-methyltransferase [Pseudomonadota bacterium]